MSEIISDINDPRLIPAVINNQVWYRGILGHASVCTWHEEPGLLWYTSPFHSWLGNLVIRIQLAPDELETRLGKLIAWARANNPALSFSVNQTSQPPNLADYLKAQGLQGYDRINNMVADLHQLNETDIPEGVSIRRLDDPADISQWIDTFIKGYELSEAEQQIFSSAFAQMDAAQRERVHLYWAWLDDKPVATAVIIYAEGIVSVYGVATRPEARRKGIGAAVTLQPLREARAQGYHIAALQAADEAYQMYKRMGFRDHFYTAAYWFPNDDNGR